MKMETSSFNTPLFWQLFVKYLILILIPSIVASTFIYFYVVHMLEQEIEKSNHMVIKNFSDQTDAIFLSLQTDVINFLETSSLQGFLRVVDEPYHLQKRMEQAHLLMRQLSSIRENEFITNAYLFFPKYDLVLDSDTYTNKDYYFGISYPMEKREKEELFAQFSKKKMMDFTQPFTFYVDQKDSANNLSFHSGLFVLTSYPYNRDKPDVYLVVNINQDKLNRSIHIDENWIASTAIVDQYGKRISQSGTLEIGEQKLADILVSNTIEPYFWNEHSEALSFVQSQFDDKWYYISLVDLQEMMRPAQTIKFFSMVFLVFFFVLGVGISYYLSRRLYIPILEIKTGLDSYRKGDEVVKQEGDEFKMIIHSSRLLISENKQLFDRVCGMAPIVQEHFLSKILLGEFRDSLSIEYYASEIDFIYKTKTNRNVICINIQYYSRTLDNISESSKSFMLVDMKEKIIKSFYGNVRLCHMRTNLLVCVVHHDSEQSLSPMQATEKIKEIVCQFSDYFKASIGVGKTVKEIEKLHDSYEHALIMLQQQSLNTEVEIYDEQHVCNDSMSWDSFLSIDEVGRIFNQVKAREYERILQSTIESLDKGIRKNVSYDQAKNLCSDILNTWIRAVESERKDLSISFYSKLFEALERAVTWDEIKELFTEIHQQLFQLEEPHARESRLSKILDYIHHHYGEDLSIERFADQLGMSAGNFSRVFKEVTGEKYVEYIAKLRLSHAKRLLLETSLKIDDIAEKVGYLGRNSFIRIFKKYEGITPGKFRTSYQRHDN